MPKKPKTKKPANEDLLPEGDEPAPEAPAVHSSLVKARRTVSLDELHLDEENARRHPEKNMAAIVGSLRNFGQVEALLVQAGTGRILAGNGRYQAMRSLGWKTAEVTEVELDDEQATALALTMNRTGELAEWDDEVLARLIGELKDHDFALEEIGFDSDDLGKILGDLGTGSGKDESLLPDQDPAMKAQFLILVSCASEKEQTDLLERLSHEGIECKAMVS